MLLGFSLSVLSDSVTPWTAACLASLSSTISRSLLKRMSVVSVMPSNSLILCVPLSPGLQSFPASGSFPMSYFFASGGQSIGASASASVLQMNIQDWFPLGLTGLISLLSKGLSRVFSSTTIWRHQFFGAQPFLLSSSHIYTWLLGNHSFDYTDLCQQSTVSAFSYTVKVYHCSSFKEQASFNFKVAVTVHSDSGAQENKICHYFCCFPIYLP